MYIKLIVLNILIFLTYAQYGNYPGTMCGVMSIHFAENVTCNYNNYCPEGYELLEIFDDIYTCVNNIMQADTSIYQGTLCGNYPEFKCNNQNICPPYFTSFNNGKFSTCYTMDNKQELTLGMICGYGNYYPCMGVKNNCPEGFAPSYLGITPTCYLVHYF